MESSFTVLALCFLVRIVPFFSLPDLTDKQTYWGKKNSAAAL